jgi:hypothetical protein
MLNVHRLNLNYPWHWLLLWIQQHQNLVITVSYEDLELFYSYSNCLEWTLRSIFGSNVVQSCPLSSLTNVYVDLQLSKVYFMINMSQLN